MSYVKTINEDGAVSDIMAKALDPTLDATLVHQSEMSTLVHTSDVTTAMDVTTAGQVADARVSKTLNDKITDINAQFNSTSLLSTTIDTVLPNGLYAMAGNSAIGTFPEATGKYGVMLSIHRGSTSSFQLLFTASKMWAREVGSEVGAWTTIK